MKKLFMITVVAGIGYLVRRAMGKTTPDVSSLNAAQPQRKIEEMERAAGEPVRP